MQGSHVWLRLAALAGCALAASTATGAAATPFVVRVGSAPRMPLDAHVTAALPAATRLRLTIALEPRDQSGLASMATAVATPGSPLFRRYLTVGQFAQRFGATSAQVAAVQRVLRAQGLSVGPASANGLTIPVTGTAARVEQAFSTSLAQVRLATGQSAYANVQAPALRSSIARFVQGVVGLDELAQNQPQQASAAQSRTEATGTRDAVATRQVLNGAPQPCQAAQEAPVNGAATKYTADQIASAYELSSLYLMGDLGAGQTVALSEVAPYDLSDIGVYQRCYGTSASVGTVSVDGGPSPPSSNTVGEVTLDIEQVIGLAPKANILVYEGPDTESASVDVLSAIVSQDAAKVISSSGPRCEASTLASVVAEENTLLQEAALQGQSFFVSSGDNGSEACSAGEETNDSLSVNDPASQPFATGVGGTSLDLSGGRSEYLWNDGYAWNDGLEIPPIFLPGEASSLGDATGGGISSLWPMPSYQSGAPASLNVINSNSSAAPCGATTFCREVPDVSADADCFTTYVTYDTSFGHGGWGTGCGTSASAPFWAAFTALVNSSAACRGVPIGFANPALYRIAGSSYLPNFHDVTRASPISEGPPTYTPAATNNMISRTGLYPVGPGYDMTTGLGTPVGSSLAASLCGAAVYQPGSPSVSDASLAGISKRKAKLTFTVSAGTNAPAVDAMLLGPPSGLTFSRSSKSLSNAIVVKGPSSKHVKLKARVSHGVLTITLASAQQEAQVTIAYPAIGVSSSLADRVKQHTVKALTFVVKAIDTSHKTTRLTLQTRPS